MADSGEMLDEVRSRVFDDQVYVFTPKGDVVGFACRINAAGLCLPHPQ